MPGIPSADDNLSGITEEQLLELEMVLQRERAQRLRQTLDRLAEYNCTIANPGKFRIFWKDTFDHSQGRHTRRFASGVNYINEWDDLDAAKAEVVSECEKNPAYCYLYIFDDCGHQVWFQGTDIPR
ncbi:hypothetical protein KBC99_01825 [Candidatus Saccharibacteria bacterium]|nr:hypothetical protein [Candidatus Saccharibacteria bacterium]